MTKYKPDGRNNWKVVDGGLRFKPSRAEIWRKRIVGLAIFIAMVGVIALIEGVSIEGVTRAALLLTGAIGAIIGLRWVLT